MSSHKSSPWFLVIIPLGLGALASLVWGGMALALSMGLSLIGGCVWCFNAFDPKALTRSSASQKKQTKAILTDTEAEELPPPQPADPLSAAADNVLIPTQNDRLAPLQDTFQTAIVRENNALQETQTPAPSSLSPSDTIEAPPVFTEVQEPAVHPTTEAFLVTPSDSCLTAPISPLTPSPQRKGRFEDDSEPEASDLNDSDWNDSDWNNSDRQDSDAEDRIGACEPDSRPRLAHIPSSPLEADKTIEETKPPLSTGTPRAPIPRIRDHNALKYSDGPFSGSPPANIEPGIWTPEKQRRMSQELRYSGSLVSKSSGSSAGLSPAGLSPEGLSPQESLYPEYMLRSYRPSHTHSPRSEGTVSSISTPWRPPSASGKGGTPRPQGSAASLSSSMSAAGSKKIMSRAEFEKLRGDTKKLLKTMARRHTTGNPDLSVLPKQYRPESVVSLPPQRASAPNKPRR